MSVDWRALREYGHTLINSEDEVAKRAGISRCYYACYHRALEHGYHEDPFLASHSNMWAAFRRMGRAAKGIEERAREAKRQRTQADYDLTRTVDERAAQEACKTTEELHALLDAIRVP